MAVIEPGCVRAVDVHLLSIDAPPSGDDLQRIAKVLSRSVTPGEAAGGSLEPLFYNYYQAETIGM